MTKQLIQRNINLSLEFDTYVAGHPHALNAVPSGADIVLTSEMDEKLSEANLSIVRNSRTGKFVEARKVGRTWKIRKIK